MTLATHSVTLSESSVIGPQRKQKERGIRYIRVQGVLKFSTGRSGHEGCDLFSKDLRELSE